MVDTIKKDNAYYPSAKIGKSYLTYAKYFLEYLMYFDFISIFTSINFVLNGKPPQKDRIATSKLGKFRVRKGTTDFQFINFEYERKIRNYLADNINNYDIFIDIGACIGEYDIWLAKKGIHCHAFEPVKKNHDSMVYNISLNDVKEKIETYNFGLGSKDEKVTFEIMDTVTGSSHIVQDDNNEGNIDIKKLDNVLGGKINSEDKVIVKLDVEGMESEVLKGGIEVLSKIKDLRVIFEHTFAGEDNVKEILKEIGNFEYVSLDDYNSLAIKQS